MENPIQQVLVAEQAAQREIHETRAAADRSVAEARLSARDLLEKAERRVNSAISRFELDAGRTREAQAAEIRQLAERQMQRSFERIENQLADIVARNFAANWPAQEDP